MTARTTVPRFVETGRRLVRGWVLFVVSAVVASGLVAPPASAATLSLTESYGSTGVGLVSLSPTRLMDTRSGLGGTRGPVKAGATTGLVVSGRGGVPASGVAAVVVNVTVTETAGSGYVTAWPSGVSRPLASNLNFVPGLTVANQAIVKVGAAGSINVYSSVSTHLVVDVVGYYPDGAGFAALTPSRLLDTRSGLRPTAGSTTPVTVTGRGGVPASGVSAVVLNITSTGSAARGFVTQWPAGEAKPWASTLNFDGGAVVAGMAIATVGAGGVVNVYTSSAAHLVVDVAGWIPATSDYVAMTPTRALDTRTGLGAPKARVAAGGVVELLVTGVSGVPLDGVNAVEATVTVAAPTSGGYITTYPTGQVRPVASVLNFAGGVNRANSITLQVGAGGKISLFSSATTDLIVDVVGYFTKPTVIDVKYDPAVTVVAPAPQIASVAPPTELGGEGSFTASGDSPADVGQYVYLPPGGTNGDGVIGKVTAVSGATTTVVAVPLEEVFPEGHIEGVTSSTDPLVSVLTGGGQLAAARSGVPWDCTGGVGSSVSGTVTQNFKVAVLADWGVGKRTHLRITLTNSFTVEFTVGVEGSGECRYTPRPIPVGAIGPFTFTVGGTIKLGVKGGISAGAKWQDTTTDGFDWWAGEDPRRIHTNSRKTTFTPPSLKTANASAELSVGPELSSKLAGLAGPTIGIFAFINVKADTGDNPWWTLNAGIKLEASLVIDVIFIIKASYTLGSHVVWSATIGKADGAYTGPTLPSSPLTITTATLPPGTAGSPYSATVAASGGVQPYQWAAQGLPAGLTMNATSGTISGTAGSAVTSAPVTVTVSDATSKTVTKTYLLTFTQGPPAPECADPLTMTMDTTAPGATTTVSIELHGGQGISVDWGGAGTPTPSGTGSAPTISYGPDPGQLHYRYSAPGTYVVRVCGTADHLGSVNTWAYQPSLRAVTSFGDLGLKSLRGAFVGATNLTAVPGQLPPTVTDLSDAFYDARAFNQPLGAWDTANVTDMGGLFRGAAAFNQPLGAWNTANVTDMGGMFWGAAAFNQPLDTWNTANVTDMRGIFYEARAFNQPLDTWNTANVTDMSNMFGLAEAFNQPLDTWNTTNVATMGGMFYNAAAFNQPLDTWNTTNVTDMGGMFGFAAAFNQPLGTWNTTNVTDMNYMFWGATAFNQPLGTWNTTNVTGMEGMFGFAAAFNQPLGAWNTANVATMGGMFYDATAFNQPLGAWNTANVTNMSYMFRDAAAFNQPLGAWNTANVTDMRWMFWGAAAFNQPLGTWSISNVRYMGDMFSGSGLSAANYSDALMGWAGQDVYPYVYLGAGTIPYLSAAAAARQTLIDQGWQITDGGMQ